MPKSKQYNRNFLEAVIFRIDFDWIELGKLDDFYNSELKRKFPHYIEKAGVEGTILFSHKKDASEFSQSKKEFTAWQFESKRRNIILQIAPKHLYLEYMDKTYKNSTELLGDIKKIIKVFIKEFKVETIKRIGLRYSNEITLSGKYPLKWKKYLNKDLLGGISFAQKKKLSIARGMGQLVIKKDEADITFNYGLFNKDFPNKVSAKEFILDYDCVSKLPFEASLEDIVEKAKLFNLYVDSLFEASITSSFRDLLNK